MNIAAPKLIVGTKGVSTRNRSLNIGFGKGGANTECGKKSAF